MKTKKFNSKSFYIDIVSYQNRIFYSRRGQCIQNAGKIFSLIFTREQVIYIHAVLAIMVQDHKTYSNKGVQIPVGLLFGLMTPYSAELYQNNRLAESYMADISRTCLAELSEVVRVIGHSEGKCRVFYINSEFLKEYCMLSIDNVNLLPNLETYEDKDKSYRFTKGCVGDGFERPSRLNKLTVASVEKFKKSRFILDTELLRTQEGRDYIVSNLKKNSAGKISPVALDNIGVALYFMNTYSNKPQYHEALHLQGSGRVHTIGGCIQLPKWFRKKFILPLDPSNLRMEVDLKCAQLLILTDLLETLDLKQTILEILDDKGSIWSSIGDPNLDKRIKKIIVYAFCFGAELRSLPYIATTESNQKGCGIKVTKETVNDCFSGLLKPLVEARELWLDQFKNGEIIKYANKSKVVGKLGYGFTLYDKVAKSLDGVTKSKVMQERKTGSNLLAFLCQSEEQFIMQSLIANHVDQNILTWAYDGMCLEVSPDAKEALESTLISACPNPLEIEYF